ncbi:hypothetical protein MMC10_006077 [Thelotrema lepadinum]|nr:hypothetical protein [Thelotrema lepadinum]
MPIARTNTVLLQIARPAELGAWVLVVGRVVVSGIEAADSAEESADEIEATAEEASIDWLTIALEADPIAEEAPIDSLTTALEADPITEEAALAAEETALPARDEAVAIAPEAEVAALPAADEALATPAEADVAPMPIAEEALATTLDPGMMMPVAELLTAEETPAAAVETDAIAEEIAPDVADAVAETALSACDDAELPMTAADEATLAGGV